MQIGIVGLGRMGGNMARRLRRAGVDVIGFDADAAAVTALGKERVLEPAESIGALARRLSAPRVVWLMVPAGRPTELAVEDLWPELVRGDLIVDGGNANYKDSQRRGLALASAGLRFVDCGVSGGVWGLENGYTLMFGGDAAAAAMIEPFVRILAPTPDAGWLHCGPCGAGHFVKMIHNGIEYAMMEAYAEGFALLKGNAKLGIDVASVAETWRHGSVVRSWLLDLTADVLERDAELADIAPIVADSGEGRWTAVEAIEQGVPAPVISLALMMRFASQGRSEYADKLMAMMRKGFGGHAVARKGAAQ
ncbi:MAG TPA: decarboxylating 6-phosphogluconate dehydrogenase [Casimicrobiaceae bacterium]|nr:decarboxylating 6-phosphogluconate dehydrogenase [Casimicrobiaceae bacterium]